MSKKLFKTLNEIDWVNDIDLQETKFKYSPSVNDILRAMFGFDGTNKGMKRARAFVRKTYAENLKHCIAFFVCPEYCNRLREFLENSYNCNRGNDPKLPKDFFKKHFIVCEPIKGNCIPYEKEGLTILDYKEAFAMKFDTIVTNPPYAGSLHLDFLNLGLDALKEKGKMVIIEPSTWLINVRKNGKAKKYDAIKKRIEGHVKSVKIENLDAEFNITNKTPLSITTIDFSKTYDTIEFECCGEKKVVDSIYDCNLIGDYNTIWSIFNKVLSYGDMMSSHTTATDLNNGSWYIGYMEIGSVGCDRGSRMLSDNVYLNNMYIHYYFSAYDDRAPISPTPIHARNSGNKFTDKIGPNLYGTKKELENWKHFIFNNKLPLFINIVLTIDQNNNSKEFLPWIVDKKYTDKEINKMFGFTKDEIALIDATIKKFERNSPWFKRYMCGVSGTPAQALGEQIEDVVEGE